MDPETKELLKENLKIAKENNALLVKMAKAQKRAIVYRVVYWAILLFFSFGLYYVIQPYLKNVLNVYSGGLSGFNSFGDMSKNFPSEKEQFQQILDSFKKK